MARIYYYVQSRITRHLSVKISNLTSFLEHVRVYLDNLLVAAMNSFDNNTVKFEVVLVNLLQAGSRIISEKVVSA